MNLNRIKRKLEKLARIYRPSGVWADYATSCSYSASGEAAKKSMVRDFLETHRPATVLDLGCNTGDYSYLAAQAGARVIAMDGDHDAVELLYRRLKSSPADIAPVVADLSSPSPGLGFRNQEQRPFLERAVSDCVLALALMHHLIVRGNLSLSMIRDQLADLTNDLLVLEFVPPDDPMFFKLTEHRTEKHQSLTLDQACEVLGLRFVTLAVKKLPDSGRSLLFLQKQRTSQ